MFARQAEGNLNAYWVIAVQLSISPGQCLVVDQKGWPRAGPCPSADGFL